MPTGARRLGRAVRRAAGGAQRSPGSICHPFPSRSSRPRRLADRAVRRAAVDEPRRMAVRADADQRHSRCAAGRGLRLLARRRLERRAGSRPKRKRAGADFAAMVSPVPLAHGPHAGRRRRSGSAGATWRVVVGSGHSPEHACLVDDAGKLMIAGDQVLPRITSNVSLSLSEPEADPLGEWLASIAKLRDAAGRSARPPSHGEPFTGPPRPSRRPGERSPRPPRCAWRRSLAEPRRAVDCFSDPVRPQDRRRHRWASPPARRWRICAGLEVEGRAVRERARRRPFLFRRRLDPCDPRRGSKLRRWRTNRRIVKRSLLRGAR